MSSMNFQAMPGKVIPLQPYAMKRRPMRVLYVVSMFPAWSETFIVREIRALLDAGVDVRIVSLRRPRNDLVQKDAAQLLDRVSWRHGWWHDVRAVAGMLVRRPALTLKHPVQMLRSMWKHPGVLARSLITWMRAIGLLEDVRRIVPDHIHAHWATYPSTAAMILADHLDGSFSITAHAHDIFLENQLMPQKLARAAFVATISEHNRIYLRLRYAAAHDARIEVIHCGVPLEGRSLPAPRALAKPPLLLSVGRHDEVKGFPILLAACAALKARGIAFHCEIVGDGPLRSMLEKRRRELGLENEVSLSGALPSEEVEERMGRASVFVLASTRARSGNMDGIPVALMEAMAHGVPVVSTRISGIPELVRDGETGLLVEPDDAAALAQALERMLCDHMLRSRCVAAAQELVQRSFNARTEALKLHALFREIKGETDAEKVADHHG